MRTGEYPYLCRVEMMYPVFNRSNGDGNTLEWMGGYPYFFCRVEIMYPVFIYFYHIYILSENEDG